MKSLRCCIPNCPANVTDKHVAFYGIKPLWQRPITKYILNLKNKQPWPWRIETAVLLSKVICGKHYRLCGIHNFEQKRVYYFPRLKLSVSNVSQNNVDYNVRYASDEIAMHHEEVFPLGAEPSGIDLSRQRKIASPRAITKHVDHNYAISVDYVRFLQHEYEKCTEEQRKANEETQQLMDSYKAEIQRLRDINHYLMKTQLKENTMSFPVQLIPENEQLLKFYTGFSKKERFELFVEMLRPSYMKSGLQTVKKQHLGMVPQLVLVLSRLRLGLMHNDLAYRFNISLTAVLKIWVAWVNLLTDFLVTKHSLDDREARKVIVECHETFLETSKDKIASERTYGRARALIELSSTGLVISVSNLHASYVSNEQIISSWTRAKQSRKQSDLNGPKNESARPADLQVHVQKILAFIKGFKILKGTFPNSVTSVKQLHVFWRLCCFLANDACPDLAQSVKIVQL